MKSIKFFLPAVLIFSAGLSACGGGGSGSSTTPTTPTTPVAQTCTNGATDFPNCIIIPASLQKPTPANYTAGSPQADVFTALNEFRSNIGLGPVNQNPLLDKAALNHKNYAYTSWIPGEDPHLEVPGRINFTGEGYLDRYRAVGFTNAVGGTEVISAPSGKEAILPLANAILHRQGMMMEKVTDVGIFSDPVKGTEINLAYSSGQSNASDFIGVYPIDKQTGVSLTHSMETPNPFSDLEMTVDNMCKQTSYPISLQSQSTTTLAVTSFTIRETGTTVDLPTRILLPNSRNIYSNFAAVIGKAPFKPNTNYTVQFVGSVAGGKVGKGFNVDKSWSFTTASKNWMTCN